MIQKLRFGLLLLMLTGAATAQNKKLKTQHITNPCAKEEITLNYDKKGKLTEEVNKTTTAKGKVVVNRTLYKYQENNPVLVQFVCNDTLVSEEASEYMNGDLVHFRRTVKGSLVLDEAYTYKKGKVLSIISTTPKGMITKTVKYDSGLKMKETTSRSGEIIIAVEREFTHGNAKTVQYFSAPVTNNPQMIKEFVFDYDGNVIDERTIIKGVETERVIQRYEKGRQALHKEFHYSNPVYEMQYDERGNPLREENFDTGEVTLYDSKFNPNHDLKEVRVFKNDKEQCVKMVENEYWD